MIVKEKYKIAVTGPESTGKTTLSELLAIHYNQVHCPEYARAYLSNLNRPATIQDIQLIHDIQMNHEASLFKSTSKLLFCDTDVLNFKIWLQHVFHQTPDWILKSYSENIYDFHLLCFPDIDWMEDGLRVNQHNRMDIYEDFLSELLKSNSNFVIIKGFGAQRLENCIAAVDQFVLDNHLK